MIKKKKIIILIIWIISFVISCFLFYSFYPIITYKEPQNKPWRIYIEDRNGIVITDKANEYWYNKRWEIDLNSQLVKDLIQIEDKNYYNHFWINILAKLRAIKWNIQASKITSWWSTITEQFIKNKYFQKHKRTYIQKLRESVIAFYYNIAFAPNEFWINSKKNNKNIILNEYLQNIYFWNNIYWIVWAIETYFNKSDLNDLTQEEIVLLISLIHSPSIKSLKESSFIEYFNQTKKRLWYDFENKITTLNKLNNLDKFPFVTNDLKSNENNRVSIDAKLQEYAENIINTTLNWLKDKNVTNWAVFAINPKTSEILLYIWSRDFYSKDIDWQVNVIHSIRQPGSTMKPFLYLMALENWAWINDLLIDIERKYESYQEWTIYISENYTLKEYWLVRLKKALWNSFNNSTTRLALELWLEKVYDFYKKYSFNLPNPPEYYWYSLVLWNPSISLFDLVYSYQKLLDLEDPYKFLLYNILKDPDNRDISFWVNSVLNTSIYQAVKTGTSSNFKDNLVVSYHPDFVIWVWVGNNNNSSMLGVTWITWAWYIWHQIIEEAIRLGYIKDKKIDIPKEITEKTYCLDINCYRKEIDYDIKDREYNSRLLNWIYSQEDLFENVTQEEREYLELLWFYLK